MTLYALFGRLSIVIVGAIGLPSPARACELSGWRYAHPIKCAIISPTGGGLSIENYCEDQLRLSFREGDAEVADSTSVVIEPRGVGTLLLSEDADGEDFVVYDYAVGDQQGQIRFQFEYDPCTSEPEGCGIAGPNSGRDSAYLCWIGIAALMVARRID